MKVSFLDFWQYPKSFNPNNNFFIHIIRELFEEVEVVHPEDADVIFFSSFGNESTMYKNCKKIFYTGENQRPNFKKCDYSLTFDYDSYDGKNFRLPLWYLYIDWFGVKTYDNPDWLIPESYLYGENNFTQKEKNKFCSTVFSSLYQHRIDAVHKLSTYKNVDVYGKSGGIFLPDGEKNKLNTISNYKFSICFENTSYPGYVTEKLLHAKIAGSLPIYYGDETFKNDFNEKCCLNLKEMTLDDMCEKVIELDNNEKKFKKIIEQPMFTTKVTLDSIFKKIYEMVKI